MIFHTNVYLLSTVSGALTTALALPLWRAWCRRTGLVDDVGHRKIHGQPIPLAGGLAILTGLLVPLLGAVTAVQLNLLGIEITNRLSLGFDRRAGQLAVLVGGAVGMTLVGWLDDKHELRPALKFAGQILVAGMVATAGIRITLFVANPIFSYAITILWIVTVTNAFNFMDNMNGLCAGLGVIAAVLIGLTAARQGHYLVAAISFLMAGATFGFLPYNFPRASAFLGDAGSHLLGYFLAVLTILPHFYSEKHPHHLAVLSPLFILALPLIDLVWVVLLRWRMGNPFYVGDTNHLSHRLVRRGWSQAQAVGLIWVLAALAGCVVFWL